MARPQSALSKFILSLPGDAPVKEVIAKAKAKGMKTDVNNVYRVRRLARTKRGAPKTSRRNPKTPGAGSPGTTATTTPAAARKPGKPGRSMPSAAAQSQAPQKTSPSKQSKADFVRSLPGSTTANEVIARAKAAGLSVSATYVYLVRRSAKGTGRATATNVVTRRATTARRGASVPRPITSTSSAEELLLAVAAEIGLGRACGILAEEHAKLRELLWG